MRPLRLFTVWAKCNCDELESLGAIDRVVHAKDEATGRAIYLARPFGCGMQPGEEDADYVECHLPPPHCRWHDPAGARYQIICVKRRGHIARIVARAL